MPADNAADASGLSNGDVLSFIGKAKKRVDDLAAALRDEVAAQHEKGQSDVTGDSRVAGARDGADGEYVGRRTLRSTPMGQSGAEARSEESRGSG